MVSPAANPTAEPVLIVNYIKPWIADTIDKVLHLIHQYKTPKKRGHQVGSEKKNKKKTKFPKKPFICHPMQWYHCLLLLFKYFKFKFWKSLLLNCIVTLPCTFDFKTLTSFQPTNLCYVTWEGLIAPFHRWIVFKFSDHQSRRGCQSRRRLLLWHPRLLWHPPLP